MFENLFLKNYFLVVKVLTPKFYRLANKISEFFLNYNFGIYSPVKAYVRSENIRPVEKGAKNEYKCSDIWTVQ